MYGPNTYFYRVVTLNGQGHPSRSFFISTLSSTHRYESKFHQDLIASFYGMAEQLLTTRWPGEERRN